jgi:hypothetical protein
MTGYLSRVGSTKEGAMRATTKAGVLTILLAGVVAAAALAGTKTYDGTFGDNGSLEFGLKTKNGKSKVVGFDFDELDGTCSQGIIHVKGTFKGPAKVKNGKFKLTNDRGTYTESAKGEIAGKQASGTLEVSGDIVPGQLDDCSTGKVQWTASR